MINPESFQQARDSIGSEPNSFPIPLRYNLKEKVYATLRITRNNISGGAVYGNSTYGIYGQSKYTASSAGAFILDSDTNGRLDYDSLDSEDNDIEIVYVINQNNLYIETFETDDFINTSNSTGSRTSGEYELEEGEKLYSQILAKSDSSFSWTTLSLEGNNIDSLNFYISGDGGSTWQSISKDTQETLSTATSAGIKIKMENPSGSGSTVTVTKYKLNYG